MLPSSRASSSVRCASVRRRRRLATGALVFGGVLAFVDPSAARAQSAAFDMPDPVRKTATTTEPPRTYVNLRVGAAGTSSNGRTEICGEFAPHPAVAIEGCGNGSELVHHDPDTQMSHYLVKVRLHALQLGKVWLESRADGGFAELQVAEDGLGFNFTDAGDGESTSGPEAGFSLRAIFPLTSKIEALAELRVTAAWMEHAPALLDPKDRFQPSIALTAGFGF